MSWYDRLKSQPSTSTSDRDTKRKELESSRLLRAKKREDRKKELQALLESRQSSEEAIKDLLDIDLEVFAGEELTEEEINTLLDSSTDSSSCSSTELIMDFDRQNEDDDEKAMDNLRTVLCPFNKEDIEFWFSQLEDQLTLIGVKKTMDQKNRIGKVFTT